MEEIQTYKGYYLLDSGKLRGSFFEKSVIFLCHHDTSGAFGFIVNRPAGTSLGKVVKMDLPPSLGDADLYIGGPVQNDVLCYLHADPGLIQTNAVPGIEYGNSIEALLGVATGFSAGKELKVLAGYSGWAGGQLEKEIASGSWFVFKSSLDYIFDSPANRVWQSLLSEMGPEYRLIAEAPENPSLN